MVNVSQPVMFTKNFDIIKIKYIQGGVNYMIK